MNDMIFERGTRRVKLPGGREVEVPAPLSAALAEHPAAKAAFEKLSPSGRKRHILAVEGAKTDETRDRRLAKIVAELGG